MLVVVDRLGGAVVLEVVVEVVLEVVELALEAVLALALEVVELVLEVVLVLEPVVVGSGTHDSLDATIGRLTGRFIADTGVPAGTSTLKVSV